MVRMILFIFLAGVLAGCASAPPAPAPEWVLAPESVYPRGDYLTGKGTGASRTEAEAAALREIAGAFGTTVSIRAEGRESFTTTNGSTEERRDFDQQTVVRVYTELFSLKYAEPWRNPRTGEWAALAYIDRAAAWEIYDPQARKEADALAILCHEAETETDAFTRALRYSEAEQYAAGEAYNTVRNIAQVLYPAKSAEIFLEADEARAALPDKITAARRTASVYVECVVLPDCPPELKELIRNAAAAGFGAAGFPIAREQGNAQAFCVITVNEGKETRGVGTSYFPDLSGAVTGSKGAVFSFSAKVAERQSALNPDAAKRRAYEALAQALRDALAGQLAGDTN